MRSLLRRTLLLLLFVAGLAPAAALAAPALWRVSDGDSSVWLFGSIHILDKDRDWRTEGFDAALAAAEHVYFEIVLDMDAYATITRLSILYGTNRDGRQLSDYLTTAQQDRLQSFLDEHGLLREQVEPLRPWMAELTLMSASLTSGGLGRQAGVELVLLDEISVDRRRELETSETQFRMFAGVPEAVQVESLMRTIESADDPNQALGTLAELWHAGNVEALGEVMNAAFGSVDTPIYKRMLGDRNRRWTTQIAQMLADNDNAMIIVGAGHLAGPVGVPTLLREAGFKVERMDRSVAPATAAGRPNRRR
ncbi:TraB/GumN family protein [Devosia sp.]|uniref:TraB/GumN family protein n=1 Tax=Devosia sp. TaxID=1871048 RepID=UPI00086A413F|nr:TraB/GumN family protein [Devosia sp.]MBN9361111.1 TraB/GumN family protein [Devosia sp.]ODS85847.1 MAG: hypothetical protein ABS47_15635 [Devosia sp. SCN 66-27]